MNVDNLMNTLLELPCSFNKEYKVISRSDAKAVRKAIEVWLATDYDTRLAALEAKVKAYESIIANSNFAAVLIKDDDKTAVYKTAKKETIDQILKIVEEAYFGAGQSEIDYHSRLIEGIGLLKGGNEEWTNRVN